MQRPSFSDSRPDARSSHSARPPLIGRAPEQAELRARLREAQAGQGRCILVGGEAGIGKTSLVEDLAREAESQGCLVLWGHAYDFSVTPPYGPWIEISRHYRASGQQPPFPDFFDDPQILAPLGSEERLREAVSAFFLEVAAQRTLVLILDDLHWADPASLDLMRLVGRTARKATLLLIGTYRTDELDREHPLARLLPIFVREASAERIDLHRLVEDSVGAFVTKYGLSAPDQSRLVTHLGNRTGGNPFYLGELLRSLEEDRVLHHRSDDLGWQLGDLDRRPVPLLLTQIIEGRLNRLEPDTRKLLELGALIGDQVPFGLWAAIGEVDDDQLNRAIDAGLGAGILIAATSANTFQFRHTLIRQVLYEGINPIRRRSLHNQIGETLAKRNSSASSPDEVAFHFQEGGDERASEWLIKAGEWAQRAYAWPVAARRFEAAAAWLTERNAPAIERAILLYRSAFVLRFSDLERALALLMDALQLAAEADDRAWFAFLIYFRGLLNCFGGNVRAGLAAMEHGNDLLRTLADDELNHLRSVLDLELDEQEGTVALWLAIVGRLSDAVARSERLLASSPAPFLHSGEFGSDYADALQGLVIAEALLGQPERARRASRDALTAYRMYADHVEIAGTCGNELELIQLPYFPEQRERRTQLALETVDAGQQALGAGGNIPARSYILPLMVLEGDWPGSREAAEQSFDSASATRRVHGGFWLARLAYLEGEPARAQELINALLPDGPGIEPGGMAIRLALPLLRLAAEMARDIGDLATARDWLEAHDRWLDWSGAVLGRAEGALGWAAFHHANDDPAQARIAAEQALAHASDPRQPLALIAVHRFLGTLDTEAAQLASADEHLQQSLTLAAACAAPFERALTLLELARLRTAQGQPEAARALLTEVRAICTPLEALPTLARVAALEAELATSPSARPHDSYPAGLTAREVEVLRLLAQGLSNPEIAERLFLSRRTVDTHLSAIYRKLDVTSRIAAARFATEHGLG